MTTASWLVGALSGLLVCACSSGSSDASAAGANGNVGGTAECNDFCAKTHSECGTSTNCDPNVYCAVGAGQCAASERAYLQCEVNTGTWTCGANGGSLRVTNNCAYQPVLCGDGG